MTDSIDSVYARFADLVSWMFFPDRRPGLLGTAKTVTGTANGRPAEFQRTSEGWLFLIDGKPVDWFDNPSDAVVAMSKLSFRYEGVAVTAHIADQLFQGAVENAEAALSLYWKALALTIRSNMDIARQTVDKQFLQRVLDVPLDDPFDFVMATSYLAKSVRKSLSSVMLGVSAAEAQVNDWAAERGGWGAGEDGENLVRKMRVVAAKFGGSLDTGSSPFQELQQAIKFRHDVVHPKPIPQDLPLGSTEQPGRSLSVQARKVCYLVRVALISVAAAMGVEPPRYLAYCPPGSYEDDDLWSSAVALTGVRDDPVFPKTVDQLGVRPRGE